MAFSTPKKLLTLSWFLIVWVGGSAFGATLSLTPQNAAIRANQTLQYTATVTGATNKAVTWTLNPAIGTISPAGLYTPPASVTVSTSLNVVAVSVEDPKAQASASLRVMPAVEVGISPTVATLQGGQSQQFSATVTGANGNRVAWSMSPLLGTLSASGLYTAPATISANQSITIRATSVADPSQSASAIVNLQASSTPVSVTVTPATSTLQPGQSQQFSASVTGTTNTAVIWSLSPAVGSITTNGLYVAPSSVTSQQTVSVIARSVADPNKSATAIVTLQPSAPAISVTVTPATSTLQPGQSQQFSASVTGTTNTAVTWSLSPTVGSITTNGLYVAPSSMTSQQTVSVIARSVADSTKSATAIVTLQPSAPAISVTVTPATSTLQPAQSQQFSASVTGTTNTAVTWSLSPAVGSITTNGLYVAPSSVTSQQTVSVIARSVADSTKSATAIVTVQPATQTVSVNLTPTTATLSQSQTQTFTAIVSGSPNTAVVWSLSPAVGTLSSSGNTAVYNAPSAISANQTVQVVATSVANNTVKAVALVTLAASVSGAQTFLQKFTLREEFGVNHPRQIVEFDFNGAMDPSRSFMIGPDGNEVPYQRLSNGKIAVETALLARQTLSWTLYSGRAPASFSRGVQVSTQSDFFEISNGITGVRVFRANGQRRTVPIASVSVANGVATITTAADHHLETVVADAALPSAKLPVTLSGISGACSYLNGMNTQVREGSTSVWSPSTTTVKVANVSGVNCTGTGGVITVLETRKAPIQGIRSRDGNWISGAGENLTWRDGYGPFNGRVLNGRAVETRIVDAGPLRVTAEVLYSYNRPARTFTETRACTTLGFSAAPCTIEAGDGFYRSTITLDAGQPSILIEDHTDMDLAYHVDIYSAVRPDQGRYQGHNASRVAWGYEADGRQYRPAHERPNMDAFRDFSYTQPLDASYTTNDSLLKRMAAWDPWSSNTGWYWMLYNKAAAASSPVVGVFAGRASRAIGVADTGPGVFIHPASAGGSHRAGFTFQTGRRAADSSAFRTSRMHWGIFVGTKDEDLGDPYQIQNINRQMNIHGGVNLTKIAALDTTYREPSGGNKPLYITKVALQRIIDRVRSDNAYYQYLYSAEPTARRLLDSWRDSSGAKAAEVAAEVRECARKMLDAWVNLGGIYHSGYTYWHAGLEMSRRAIALNDLLLGNTISEEEKRRLYAVMVLFGAALWDDDIVPLFDGHGLNLGTANMPVQQTQYREMYTLMLADHPMMATRANLVSQSVSGNLRAEINEFGAQRGSPHYAGASMGPLLSTLQQLQINTASDLFQTEDRIRKFAEFYLNFLTPPEVRFGGVRKMVSLGDGSTQSSELYGQMATAFAGIDPALSARLMRAWIESGKPHSGFHGTTIVKIDDSLPSAPLNLTSATFPGWHSVLRSAFGTPNESAAWFINGDHYSDHRHADHGSVSLYALGSPLSVDWGSMYSPQAAGAYAHSMVLPESSIGASWNADGLSTNTGSSPWRSLGVNVFGAFQTSSVSSATFQTANGTLWTRTLQLIHANPVYPVIAISDRFAGPDAAASKVFSLNLMAQGAVETPAGLLTPIARLYDHYGTRKEYPSAGAPFALGSLNRFRFTGQWTADWDLYTFSLGSQQALLGNWGHTWHPNNEQNEFRKANGRTFSETQHILRLRGTGPFRVLLLPYPKTAPRADLSVTQNNSDVVIRAGGEETIVGERHFAFRSATRTIVTTTEAAPAAAYGVEISGGPLEVVIQNGRATVTAHGPAGERRVVLPGFTQASAPMVYRDGAFWLSYAGGNPVTVVVR